MLVLWRRSRVRGVPEVGRNLRSKTRDSEQTGSPSYALGQMI